MALDSIEKPQSRPTQSRSPHSSGDIVQPQPNPFSRLRAKTVHAAATMPIDEAESPLVHTDLDTAEGNTDVFERKESASSDEVNDDPLDSPIQDLPERFNELPIELVSLTDRFVASLTTRIYSTPPSIDRLSDLYQEFYIRAASHIATHVSTLASRLNRESSPSNQSRTSRSAKKTQDSNNGSEKGGTGSEKKVPAQQMLTATEVAERRKARKLLQYKQHALEEAVERRVCESIYDKIWRHRSTIDEIRDEKLRSKTAALSVMEIGLHDLGVDIPGGNDEDVIFDPKDWLASASQSLTKMNEEKFPLGKLQHLTAAHKAIVDALTNVQPSSSSADEILPTLIYTLIISPPEETNSISNLMFIQRFRSSNKIDGETAYCLTNLEAAISFLENVDVTSLRGEEAGLQLQSTDNANPDRPLVTPTQTHGEVSPSLSQSTPADIDKAAPKAEDKPVSYTAPSTQQRLTNLFQPPAKALGAANDIVRNTADQGFKNISNTLDNSFNILFGRLKEVQINQGGKTAGGLTVVPKTLDDARRLVRKDSGILDDNSSYSEDGSIKDNHTTTTPAATTTPRPRLDDRLAELVGGRRQNTNNHATTKVTPTTVSADGNTTTDEPPPKLRSASTTPAPSPQTPNAAFGSVRNIQSTLNPLNHIPSMIRGLGRNASESPQSAGDKPRLRNKTSGLLTPEPSANRKIDPPIEKFVEMKEASDLKLGDIPELLADYKRLAMIIDSMQSN